MRDLLCNTYVLFYICIIFCLRHRRISGGSYMFSHMSYTAVIPLFVKLSVRRPSVRCYRLGLTVRYLRT